MIAKYQGTCADCGQPIITATSQPGTYRKRVAHRWHAFPVAASIETACGNVADSIIHLVLAMSEEALDGPNGSAIANGLVEAAAKMVGAYDPMFETSFSRSFGEYVQENDGWDGEPRPTIDGLVYFLMASAGRVAKAVAA